jgi:hypothetical protein
MQSSKPKNSHPFSSVTIGTAWPDQERATRSEERENPATKELAPRSSLLAPTFPPYSTHLRRAADVATAPVEWLWPGRIPIGKVTLLVGDPGLGKSLIALDLAARVSTGAAWPDEERGSRSEDRDETAASAADLPFSQSAIRNPKSAIAPGPRPSTLNSQPASVLLLNSEDDLADTIRPRLEAHGADCNRIFHVDSVADLRNDFEQLRVAVERTPDCRLIIVDPVNAFVGPNDSNFHTVVRKVLSPLAKLATQKRLAVVAVTHLRKLQGAAIHRATGSMGFVAAARAVWTICRDPADPNRQLFVPLKSNLAATSTVLALSIEAHPTIDSPVVRWHPPEEAISVAQILAPPPKQRGPQAEELRAAQAWLREHLAGGKQAAHDVIDAGEERGFHVRTLRRGLRMMGGHTERVGFLGGWWWSLPGTASGEQPAEKIEKPVPLEKNGPARTKSAASESPKPSRARLEDDLRDSFTRIFQAQ